MCEVNLTVKSVMSIQAFHLCLASRALSLIALVEVVLILESFPFHDNIVI